MAAVTPLSTPPATGVQHATQPTQPRPGAPSFREVLGQTSEPTAPSSRASWGVDVLSRMEVGRKRLDEIIAQARAGKTFRPRELLALQAEIYRISEEVSLVHKVVEEGMSAVKRLWNLQV